MPMPLDQWQKRLEGHFTELASARSASDFPLFALEHGLSDHELEEINGLLRSRLAGNLWLPSHWLVWVVYATEFGYDYEGDEYWLSYEEHTPGWRERTSRDQLRKWFVKFQAIYRGVTPSGAWAGQFPIIAWPITHAILPKYLQWQFAKTLHDLRYQIGRLGALTPEAVGQLLAANAWEASSRFRVFLQQEELAGRIGVALLSDKKVEGISPIYEPTLQRLVSDLEQVQSTREWLKETRRFVSERVIGTGRAPGPTSTGRDVQFPMAREDRDALPNIRPTLMLRRSGGSTWSVVIDVPSLSGIARLHPELRTFLSRTRCQIVGTGTWHPAGWLLAHNQRSVLKSWPGAAPLLKFEQENPAVEHLIASESRLSDGSVWLCRLGDDGLAREITGRAVRPRGKYILLSEKAFPSDAPLLAPCGLDCDGANAALLSTPDFLSAAAIDSLQRLGLQVARTVRIWPAGLCARGWDGEGHSEWLTTETPCFGIVHDHSLDGYVLRLDNGAETFIKAGVAGSPVFIKIPALPAGKHALSVKARRTLNTYGPVPAPPTDGVVTLEVREPEPWIPGTTSHAGLAVSMDPPDPSLNTFWEGSVGLSVLGPAGHHVTCSISLSSATRAELLSEQIGTFELPVFNDAWAKKRAQFLNDDRRTYAYMEASSGRFLIRGEELGEYALLLERDVKPVRWVCRSVHGVMTVRLIDDTGSNEAASCRFLSFRHPAQAATLNADSVLSGFQVPVPGGLFEARNGEFSDTIVASTPQIEGGLQGLVIEPDLHDLDAGTVSVVNIIDLLRLWSETHMVGPLVNLRRSRIIDRLINRLFSRLCGSRWAEAEKAFLSNPDAEATLQQLQRSLSGSPGFPAVLRRDYERMEAGTGPGTQWYAEICSRYGVCSEKGLCEFALQLASRPHHLPIMPVSVFEGLLAEVKGNSVLLRGARLLALLAATKDRGFSDNGLPRWKW